MIDAKKLFDEFHSSPMGGHSGILKTRHAISSSFNWEGMSVHIDTWVCYLKFLLCFLLFVNSFNFYESYTNVKCLRCWNVSVRVLETL